MLVHASLIESRTITIRESECDPVKASWSIFGLPSCSAWLHTNAAGGWHCRQGLDTIWLLLLCYLLSWFWSIVSFSNSNKACCMPREGVWGEFYQENLLAHKFSSSDLLYPVENKCWGNTWSFTACTAMNLNPFKDPSGENFSFIRSF